jgi:hypothetical protein
MRDRISGVTQAAGRIGILVLILGVSSTFAPAHECGKKTGQSACKKAKSSDRDTQFAEQGELRWEVLQLSDNLNEGITVADVNNDGTLDITAGPYWYEGPNWARHPLRDMEVLNDEFMDSNGEHALDLNGDGWVDILSATWFSDDVHWYENPGKEGLAEGKKWTKRLAIEGPGSCEGSILHDLDKDGTPELVLSAWSSRKPLTIVRIFPGEDGAMPTFERIDLGSSTGHGAGVGDINGDGRPDIFVPKGWFEHPGEKWFEKDWTFHQQFDFHRASLPCLILDITGDGKSDVLVGSAHAHGLFMMEQGPKEDGVIAWKKHLIDDSFSQAHVLRWADLNGDGKPELITGKRWRGHKGGDPGADEPVCLFRYTWHADAQKFEKDVITHDQNIGTGMQIRITDIDKDGKPDIAVAGKTGTYLLFNRGATKQVADASQARSDQ